MYSPKLSLVFCNTKKRVDEIAAALQVRGYCADAIHGDMNQSQRDRVMAKFRNGSVEILIATDVAARGIDVENIDMVFNFDIPKDDENYVHRIGRTGRAGKAGKAYNFVAGKDIYKLRDIQRYTKAIIKRKNIPSLADVENTKTTIMLDKIREVLKGKDLEKYARMTESLISDEVTSLDVAAALLKMTFAAEKKEQKSDIFAKENGMIRLFINLGKKDNVKAGDLVGAITNEAKLDNKLIGNIKILDAFSFIEVPQEHVDKIVNTLQSSNIKGKKVFIGPAKRKYFDKEKTPNFKYYPKSKNTK